MPTLIINPVNIANQGFDSLPIEIKPATRSAETLPAMDAVVNTPIANQGYGHGIAKTYSGGIR
jgi:hypothetical protein